MRLPSLLYSGPAPSNPQKPLKSLRLFGTPGAPSYGQKIKTAAKMAVVQASTMKQLSAPFPTAPHGSA